MNKQEQKQPGIKIYSEWLNMESVLSYEQIGKLTIAALKYGIYGTAPNFAEKELKTGWMFIGEKIDRDSKKYQQQCQDNALRGRYAAYKRKREAGGQDFWEYDEWLERIRENESS